MVTKKNERVQLRLIQGGPDAQAPTIDQPIKEPTAPKSQMGKQLTSFADDLDKQIQAWLNL